MAGIYAGTFFLLKTLLPRTGHKVNAEILQQPISRCRVAILNYLILSRRRMSDTNLFDKSIYRGLQWLAICNQWFVGSASSQQSRKNVADITLLHLTLSTGQYHGYEMFKCI